MARKKFNLISGIEDLRSGLTFLKFPEESEKAFRHYYYRRSIYQVRVAFFLAICLYGIVGLIDPYVVTNVTKEVRVLRYLVALPVFMASLIALFTIRKEIVIQVVGTISVFVGAVAVAFMMCLDPGIGGYLYFSGFLLTVIYGYTFIRLRVGYASICGWAATVLYVITAVFPRHVPMPILVNNTLFAIIANTIGMFVAYVLEANLRSEYLNAITMNRANRQLHKLSLFDDLTKVPNRRLFDLRLSFEFNRLRKTGQPLSLIIADIDYFKEYNDHYGHPGGDHCLVRIAETLQQFAGRTGDLAARYGGEEFAVILANTSLPEARIRAEKIRQEVRRMNISHPNSSAASIITLSLGAAAIIPSRYNSFTDLIMAADDALYRAKNNGRDRVEISAMK